MTTAIDDMRPPRSSPVAGVQPMPAFLALRGWRVATCSASIVGAALFLFGDLGRFPIVMWDESRLAVNALEMTQQGMSLVTTYGFEPDLWNTKPPLQIWLMALALKTFSSAEFALRTPSALAALLTVILTAAFTWRLARSGFAALVAAALLISSPGYYGPHVAMTGDYDALLVLFTTAYLMLSFVIAHRAASRSVVLFVLMGICIAGAVLTKSVAGLMPGFGIVIYLTLVRRWRRILTPPGVAMGALVTIVPIAGFYLSRELASPGFLEAVWQNEFSRYVIDLVPDTPIRSPLDYLQMLTFSFSLGVAPLIVIPIAWLFSPPRLKLAIRYFVLIAVVFLVVIAF